MGEEGRIGAPSAVARGGNAFRGDAPGNGAGGGDETEVDRPGPCRPVEAECLMDLRSDLIARATDRGAQVEEEFVRGRLAGIEQDLDASLHDAGCDSTPPCVKERNRPRARGDEIDGDAICDGDGEEHALGARHVGIRVVRDDEPGGAGGVVHENGGPVDLAGVDRDGHPGRFTKCAPPPEHGADRLPAGQPEIEWRVSITPAGDPLDDPGESFLPLGVAVEGHVARGPLLPDDARGDQCPTHPRPG